MTPWILANNGRPFTDAQAAQVKRELLRAELGGSIILEVRPHPDGGYAICCPSLLDSGDSPSAIRHLLPRSGSPALSAATAVSSSNAAPLARRLGWPHRPYPDQFRLSPATRAFSGYYLLVLVGLVLLFEPHLLFVLFNVRFPVNQTLASIALGAIMIGGTVIVLLSLGRLLWACSRSTYVVDRAGVQQIEWTLSWSGLLRRVPRIRFEHLRTVEVDQSLSELLLNVGTIRLTAGASSAGEVILHQVPAPRRLQAELQRRMQQALRDAATAGLAAQAAGAEQTSERAPAPARREQ